MSIATEPAGANVVLRLARDSRPPARCWTAPVALRKAVEVAGLAEIRAEADDTVTHLVPMPGAALPPDPDLPEVREWASMLAVGIVQVLGGRRPVSQLERWLSPASVTQLSAATALTRRRARTDRTDRGPDRARVRSVHVQCVSPRVAEVSVHVGTSTGSSAMALRLEGAGSRWCCTALALDVFLLLPGTRPGAR